MRQILLISFVLLSLQCSRSDLQKGNIALELGDYELAIKFFSKILEKNPAKFEARVGLGKALLQKANDNPSDTMLWKKAIINFEAAQSLSPTTDISMILSEIWSKRASLLLHTSSDTVLALEAITKAISFDPRNTQALNLAAIIYFNLGRKDKAQVLLKKATEIDSTDPATIFNLGMVYWEEDSIKLAHSCWLKALKLSPEDEEFLYWFAAAERKLRILSENTSREVKR